MPFRDIPDPEERSVLTTALDEYCQENGIDPASAEYADAQQLIRMQFNKGHRAVEDLKAAVRAAIHREHALAGAALQNVEGY